MERSSLGDRMKGYELASKTCLPRRLPIIVRLDGAHFHTYTRGLDKPFDDKLIVAMNQTAIELCSQIQGAQLAFTQSDEVSILIHNYKHLNSGSWHDNAVQKMVSVAAGIASSTMTKESSEVFGQIKPAVFDARIFVVPEAEVCNYFVWRQKDQQRNSIQMVARSIYSDKQCYKKNKEDLKLMIINAGQDWGLLHNHYKYGRCIVKTKYERNDQIRTKWKVQATTPIFQDNPSYINDLLKVLPEQSAENIIRA